MTYYAGGSAQFYHHEFDGIGGALSPIPGRWRSSNLAVATIGEMTGLANWIAPGDAVLEFVASDYRRAGFKAVTVHSAQPVALDASPPSVDVFAGAVQLVTITGIDALSDLIADLEIDSVTSSNDAIAVAVPINGFQFFVVGMAAGAVTITVVAGAVTLPIATTVAVNNITQAQADARYRLLSVLINDSEIFRVPRVDLGHKSGAFALAWTRASRSVAFTLDGDTTTTVSALPFDEFMFMDTYQDATVGHHAWALAVDGALPPLRWDNDDEPPDITDSEPGDRNSFMLYNDGINVVASRTYLDVPTI